MVGWCRNIGAAVRQRLVEANHQARTRNAFAEQSTSTWRIPVRLEGPGARRRPA
jgi:hypothetical protein